MKIELEAGAKILGTKKVSGNGQVSGLTEYAGKEVMVILIPKSGKGIKTTPEQVVSELETAINEHMKLAFKQYKKLEEMYGSPEDATRQFIKKMTPKQSHALIDDVDKWLQKIIPEEIKKKGK
jgi:hypothetical protein